MKRISIITLVLLLVLGVTACKEQTDGMNDAKERTEPISSSMSDEEIIEIADRLVKRGRTVFLWYGSDLSTELGIEIEDEIFDFENDGSYWQAVGIFDTMAELKAETEAVFSQRFCEQELYPLIELGKFREFDGVLYHNQNVGGMGWPYSLPKEWQVDSVGEDEIKLTAICEVIGEEQEFVFYLVYEDGNWKLDYFYNMGRMNIVQVEKTAQALMVANMLGSSWEHVAESVEPYDLSLIAYYCFLMSDYSEIPTQSFEARMEIDFGLSADFLHQLDIYDQNTDTYQIPPDILTSENFSFDTFFRIDAIEELEVNGKVNVAYRILWGPMAGEGDGTDTAFAGKIILERIGDYYRTISVTVTEDHSDKYDSPSTTINLSDYDSLTEEYLAPIAISSMGGIDWSDPDSIPPDHFVSFYAFKALPNERNLEEEDIISLSEYESFILQYFDVSIDHLRTAEAYEAANGQYTIGYLGSSVSYAVTGAVMEGDLLTLSYEYYSPADDVTIIRTGTLKIAVSEDSYKYVSCSTTAV